MLQELANKFFNGRQSAAEKAKAAVADVQKRVDAARAKHTSALESYEADQTAARAKLAETTRAALALEEQMLARQRERAQAAEREDADAVQQARQDRVAELNASVEKAARDREVCLDEAVKAARELCRCFTRFQGVGDREQQLLGELRELDGVSARNDEPAYRRWHARIQGAAAAFTPSTFRHHLFAQLSRDGDAGWTGWP